MANLIKLPSERKLLTWNFFTEQTTGLICVDFSRETALDNNTKDYFAGVMARKIDQIGSVRLNVDNQATLEPLVRLLGEKGNRDGVELDLGKMEGAENTTHYLQQQLQKYPHLKIGWMGRAALTIGRGATEEHQRILDVLNSSDENENAFSRKRQKDLSTLRNAYAKYKGPGFIDAVTSSDLISHIRQGAASVGKMIKRHLNTAYMAASLIGMTIAGQTLMSDTHENTKDKDTQKQPKTETISRRAVVSVSGPHNAGQKPATNFENAFAAAQAKMDSALAQGKENNVHATFMHKGKPFIIMTKDNLKNLLENFAGDVPDNFDTMSQADRDLLLVDVVQKVIIASRHVKTVTPDHIDNFFNMKTYTIENGKVGKIKISDMLKEASDGKMAKVPEWIKEEFSRAKPNKILTSPAQPISHIAKPVSSDTVGKISRFKTFLQQTFFKAAPAPMPLGHVMLDKPDHAKTAQVKTTSPLTAYKRNKQRILRLLAGKPAHNDASMAAFSAKTRTLSPV